MKKQHYQSLFLIVLLVGILPSIYAKDRKVHSEIDWPEFMRKQDMVWETLPEKWYESVYLGNGMLGLMIYKEPDANYIRFETGNCAVHDHRETNDLFGIPRLLTGHFALHPKGKILNGTMRLDLWNAEASAIIKTTEGEIHLRSIVHADEMIIITQLTCKGNEDSHWEWIPASADSPRYIYGKDPANKWMNKLPDDYQSNPKAVVEQTNSGGISVQRLLAGGETAVVWKENREKKGECTLWITLNHSYPELTAKAESIKEIDRISNIDRTKLQEQHRTWWNTYYPISFLTLPEGIKENFYWIQMYKLASATRGDRALIDTTGPWLTETPWPNAWWNLNVQLTYWPLNPSGRLELAGSLENALYNHIDNLRNNVPEPYETNSLAIGRSSNLECKTLKVGIPGVSEIAEIGSLTWACHNLWLIYRCKMDDDLLREKLFPLLKQSINYYLHFLIKEADGKLHLPKTYSPEYSSTEDCNYDLALLRWGCQTLLQITERLQIDDPLIPRWRTTLNELTPCPVDENGFMIGRNVPYASSHRHYSHLLSVYPLYLINNEQPDENGLIEKSLNYWQSKSGAHQGYSLTGASSISASIGKGNDALNYLNGLFGRFLSANTFYRESGPVIETPLSGVQSIHDMLLQSWGGKIRVFPAVPDRWQDVAYDGFRTEGAFKITAKRKAGKTEFINIKSLAGEPCVLVMDITTPVFKGKRSFNVERLKEGVYRIDLKKGEEALVYPEGALPDFTIRPIDNVEINCFGKKAGK